MHLLAFDLGGTKLNRAVFNENGDLLYHNSTYLENRKGKEVGELITKEINIVEQDSGIENLLIKSIGICVPGIYHADDGTVWAPNIPGWDNYNLLTEIRNAIPEIPISIDSDRACSILGEQWKGNAIECEHAIFLAVGTGIGAGILIDGKVLRGADDIAGAIGWMALNKPFKDDYVHCGCFEYYASGDGIARTAKIFLKEERNYSGDLRLISEDDISSYHIFEAYKKNDLIAIKTVNKCIEYWGMAAANLVSIFNPQKIIFGGGVFGPATPFIPQIKIEAEKWAQPISIKKVQFESTALGSDAAVYGAGYLAIQNLNRNLPTK